MTTSRVGLILLLLPGVGYLALFFGLPLALAFATSLGLGGIGAGGPVAPHSGPTLANYVTLITDSVYRDAIAQTIWIAVAPTLASLAVALPLAVVLRASFPGRLLFLTLYKIPLVVPGIVAAFIVMILFDRGGEISRLLKPLGLSLPKLVRDDWSLGVIIALAWKSIPFMTLIIGGALAAIPADLAPAARSLGAGRAQVFWRIELPLALPGITAATLLVFIGSIGAFAVPSLLGPIYPKPLSVWMYEAAYTRNDWGLAAAMGTAISAIAGLVLVAYYHATAGLRHATGGETR
jgi:putative spermidine/putrescine transport system permease protein